jgi:hypothetical protein
MNEVAKEIHKRCSDVCGAYRRALVMMSELLEGREESSENGALSLLRAVASGRETLERVGGVSP